MDSFMVILWLATALRFILWWIIGGVDNRWLKLGWILSWLYCILRLNVLDLYGPSFGGGDYVESLVICMNVYILSIDLKAWYVK